MLTMHRRNERYGMVTPSFNIRNIMVGSLRVELGGTTRVECSDTGYVQATSSYHGLVASCATFPIRVSDDAVGGLLVSFGFIVFYVAFDMQAPRHC